MNSEKIFPFEGIAKSTLPPRPYTGDISYYIYHLENTSTDQFLQMKITFEIFLAPGSVKTEDVKFTYIKEYSLIDKTSDQDELLHLLYDCIVDAYGLYILEARNLNLSYISPERMELKSFEEQGPGFAAAKFRI
jgi:hypothetical protein